MKSPWVWIAVAVALGVGGYAYWQSRTITPQAPATATATPPPPAIADPIPRILYPLPEPAGPRTLPALADSDTAMQETLAGLFGRESIARFFQLDEVARRFVATVDNLPRQSVSQRLLPSKPVPGQFVVTDHGASAGAAGGMAINPDNYLRYGPYVRAAEGVEAKKLVAAYLHFYPLFQQAYVDLGYPRGYFNDRLVAAIDDLLAAPDVAAAALVQPKVLYQFADPALESRSAGQKMMIRMGPANAARMKDKLRAIRREILAVTTGVPKG